MGAADLLKDLQRRGVSVTIKQEGNRLRVRGPHDEADLAALRHHKAELIVLLSQPTTSPPRDHDLLDLTDTEIEHMARRAALAQRAGYSVEASEQIADRLLRRDRQGLDMHCCLECHRRAGAYCTGAQALHAARDWRPAQHTLQRCPAFIPITAGTN